MTPDVLNADCCIAGGGAVPSDMIRDVTPVAAPQPGDMIGNHLTRLVSLHPRLVRIQRGDLASMNDQTKRRLLADVYRSLGMGF